ncbi:MAG: hypothetical protein M1816_002163 [Peltula sp. TS41687]|nr:MAG: hypothetical protein M1816_002163 [Peltula sp. TS41687]
MITYRWLLQAASLVLLTDQGHTQSFSNCNPLTSGGCSPDPALGRAVSVDLTQGASDSFTVQGNPTFDSNGASFTIGRAGDAPQINSKFYIMFGRLDITLKAAPGAGIVSSVVMQSDVLDEIDWEWLGAGPDEVQSNYFGKGQTTTYNRGAFHPDPGSQSSFKTYTIDWTANQIVWQIDGQTVRALRLQDAAPGQYPQTPMQIKIGAWSGGDAGNNAPGTIAWARGPTDFSQGPFTMQVKALTVTDYSTGSQYVYKGQDGTWQSIAAVGGQINPSGSGSAGSQVVSANAPAITSASPGMPAPFGGTHRSNTATLPASATSPTNYPGLPAGWTVTSEGKVLPPSAASSTGPLPSSLPSSPVSPPSGSVAAAGVEVSTGWDERGFPTTYTIDPARATMPKSFDSRGFLITGGPNSPQNTGRPALAGQNGGGQFAALSVTSKGVAAVLRDGGITGGILAGILGGALML